LSFQWIDRIKMSGSEVNAVAVEEFKASVASKRFDTDVAPCFYNWREVFPELQVIYDNIDIIKEESKLIGQVKTYNRT